MVDKRKTDFEANILVVDDNPKNLQLISTVVSESGYKVSAVNSGENALKYLNLKHPDLILLDVMMPGMNGYEVCRIIKSDEKLKEIPIIFLTAKNETEDIVAGFSMGAVDYITKPFKTEEVLVRLSTHIQLTQSKKLLKEKNSELAALNQKLLESRKKIKQDAEKLATMNAEKDKFFSILAHDLRGPFSGCVSLTEILSSGINELSKEDISDYAITLQETASMMNKLLENLLEWARMQMGLIGFEPKNHDFESIIDPTIELYQAEAAKKDIRLITNIQSGLNIYTDANMLQTVIRNLLSNAVKFTRKGGSIKLQAQIDKDIIIRIDDTGIGIPPELLDKLFRIDHKVSRPGTDGELSSGLGLIICKDFVGKMGGKIVASSQIGAGSTFEITLPATKPQA